VTKGFRYVLWVALALVVMGSAAATELRDLEGNVRDLDEFRGKGKWTLVMFWASDCHVCNSEILDYVTFHDAHHEKDATVVGVSLDGQARLAQAQDFVERHLVEFPNLIGEPRQVAALFTRLTGGRQPWLGTPSFLLYRPSGELVGWQVGAVGVDTIEKYIGDQAQDQPG